MIRPYVAVLKDSFHEAFASRVLWILLVVSTLLLAALAPLGLTEQRASRLQLSSVRDWPALLRHIRQDAEKAGASPGKRVWELAGDDFRQSAAAVTRAENPANISRDMVSKLLDDLNRVLASPAFYAKAAWDDVELDSSASRLIEKGTENLSQDDLVLLNRQLLRAAFPAEIAHVPDEELVFSYFGRPFGTPLPVSRRLAEPMINQFLAQVINLLVGSVAVFVAILVTSTIIPQMFDAGAVDLLLSKPVARPLLFLVKFFGGCVFILLNGSYFVVGLWAVMGLRFGLWNHALLWCIPVFLFLFVVYYSVSALAAVLWKNAIVSIVVTILFWAACFTVGTAKGLVEQFVVNPIRIVNLVRTGDSLIAVNQSGEFQEWRSGAWETVLKAEQPGGPPFGAGPFLVGPAYDPAQKQLVYLQRSPPHRFRFFSPATTVITATWSAGSWKQEPGPPAPAGAAWLFLAPGGEVIAIGSSGVFRLNGNSPTDRKELKIFGLAIPSMGSGPFASLGPKPALALADPFSAAIDPGSGDVVVYSEGALRCLRRDKDGQYRRGPERTLDGGDDRAAIAFAGENIVVARQGGRVLLLAAADLTTRNELRLGVHDEPYLAKASPNGHWFAVLLANERVVLLDAEGNPRLTLGNAASAVAFEGNENLLVADRGARVTRYKLDSLKIVDRYEPGLDMLQAAYRYFILPFYTIFPKPGELGNVVTYLLTDQPAAMPGEQFRADPRQMRAKADIYGPIWSSLSFVVVVLAVTCVYVSRKDF